MRVAVVHCTSEFFMRTVCVLAFLFQDAGSSILTGIEEDGYRPQPTFDLSKRQINEMLGNNIRADIKTDKTVPQSEINSDEGGHRGQKNSPESRHLQVTFADQKSLKIGKSFNEALRVYMKAHATGKGAKGGVGQVHPQTAMPQMSAVPPTSCPSKIDCSKCYKYRSLDGTCNNLQNPTFGKSRSTFQRLMSPDYADGISDPRTAVDGSKLPSARLVSARVIPEIIFPYQEYTLLFSTWGQFTDHDLTLTPTFRADNGSAISCCPTASVDQCFQIEIPTNDPFYAQFNHTCMNFVRSLASLQTTCQTDPNLPPIRHQINQLTSYMDASQVYGSGSDQAKQLRLFVQGKLVTTISSKGIYPPHASSSGCNDDPVNNLYCYVAGDSRATEQPLLITLHIGFLRFHNDLCKQLSKYNPHWDDETIYQEARRIVAATSQHITYNEFLPILFGPEIMSKYDLWPLKEGYSNKYDANLDSTIYNEFAAAGFRFGHSTVPSLVQLVSQNGTVDNRRLRDELSGPYNPLDLGGYARGFTSQHCEHVDNGLTKELTNYLFSNGRFGFDLASLNIQRGRDHGLPSYTKARIQCGLPPVKTWKYLAKVMSPKVANLFKMVYRNVKDIDLWPAGISETPFGGAIVGQTLLCILIPQFKNTKFGDRFWYENRPDVRKTAFSPEQLGEIKKMNLAVLLCKYSEMNMARMESMNSDGDPINCNDIYSRLLLLKDGLMNISYWKSDPDQYSPILPCQTNAEEA